MMIIMRSNDELLRLLSFAKCRDKGDVLRQASVIARELMQNWKIVSPKGERRFWGLEFYISIPDIFEDNATHQRNEQLERGTFYFHTKTKNPNWSPPIFNRHGVDITCGDKDRDIHGGLLLRHLGGAGHRDGSGLALRSLVRGNEGFKPIKRGSPAKWSKEEVSFFEQMNSKPVFGHEMYLEFDPLSEEVKIQEVTRVGIDSTNYAQEKLGFMREIIK
jgi:hypothetical protein